MTQCRWSVLSRVSVCHQQRLSHRINSHQTVHVELSRASERKTATTVSAIPHRKLGVARSDITSRQRLAARTSIRLRHCGLRLGDSAIDNAVGLQLGANICRPHQCPAERLLTSVVWWGSHGLSCTDGGSRPARHYSLNVLVWRAMAKPKADISRQFCLEMRGTTWWCHTSAVEQGKCLKLNVTVSHTLAQ